MSLFFVIALLLLGAIAPILADRYGRGMTTLATAIAPAIGFAYIVSLTPQVLAGEHIIEYLEWIPAVGLTLSLHLDGLALMFALLILGIGLLIILYASYYLSDKEDTMHTVITDF